jgi:hypothetical protein
VSARLLADFPHFGGLFAFGFANPWLLIGLGLGAIPILLHLLYRRVYRETDWAAMRFLIEAARKNSRRMRVEQLILLAVRVLILVAIALAFAEPMLRVIPPAQHVRAPIHRVLVIDASYSMARKVNGETQFERAKKLARQIVSQSHPGDAINLLLLAGRSAKAIVREPAFEPDTLLSEIARLKVTDEAGRLDPTIAEMAEILADARAPKQKELIFISDFQRTTWGGDADAHLNFGLVRGRISERDRVELIDVGSPRSQNVAVTSFHMTDAVALIDRALPLHASIRNFGETNLAAQRIELLIDGYPTAVKLTDLSAGSETTVDFQHSFRAAGEHTAEIRLPSDELTIDDQRWVSIPVVDRMKVLIVNGRPGGRPAESAALYVRTALAPATSRAAWTGATLPKVINEADLGAEDLSQFDCVFLCDVALFTPSEASLLNTYVDAGGGLVFTLGDRVKPENYNALLYRDGKGILPAAIGSRVSSSRNAARGGFQFTAADLDQPILAPFRGNPRAGLENPVTLEYFQARLHSDSNARVLLRFKSADPAAPSGDPALIAMPVGRGRSVLLTTAADVSWGTWPVHPTFPPIVHETVRYAASGRWHERQRLVGEPIARNLSGHESAVTVVVKEPGGDEKTLRPLQNENRTDVVFPETERRGIYEMVVGPAASQRELYAVNVDTRESDLASADEKTLQSLFGGIPIEHRSDWSDVADVIERGPVSSSISIGLLAATIGLLLVEPLMAWKFRYGFALLCALIAAALATVVFPRTGWALAAAAILSTGFLLTLLSIPRGQTPSGRRFPVGGWNGPWNWLRRIRGHSRQERRDRK